MLFKIYHADTCELLDQAYSEDTSLPKSGEPWPLADGAKTVAEAVYVIDPAKGEMFIEVKVR